jgi:amidase
MQDIWRLSATEVAALVRAKKISAREAMRSALERLDKVNPLINAVVDHRPEDALAQADAVDAKIARGENPGPLAGVPVTIKVLTDQKGYATTNGLKLQRDLIAQTNSPMVDNFWKGGAAIVGRTNTPAFSYRWFTDNQLYGLTKNPRNNAITPGGSSGGAAAATAAGIGHVGHGTDIAGSVRYPAYACGIHGLRLSLGRAPNFNASGPERSIGSQIMAVSGPIARTVGDLRLALQAMAAPDPRDPWYVPAPLEGPPFAKRVALCIAPDGLEVVPEVRAALVDAGKRLERAGWTVEELTTNTPPLKEAAQLQVHLWIGDNYAAQLAAAEREGDPGALACLRGHAELGRSLDFGTYSKTLSRRATLARDWQMFFAKYPAVLMPVSGELPFPDQLDLRDAESWARVWRAQMPVIGTPFMGLPGLTVSTGMVGQTPVGVQLVAARYREDILLAAGEAIEAGGVPPSPVDPVGMA